MEEDVEWRGASIEDRAGEYLLLKTIHIAVLREYYCRENISLDCVIGLDIGRVLVMTFDSKMTLIDI